MDRLPLLLLRARAVILSSGLCRKRVSRRARHRTSNSLLTTRHRKSAHFCRQLAAATIVTTNTIEAPSVVGRKPISTPVRPSTCTRRASVLRIRIRNNKIRDRLGLGLWGRNLREDRWISSGSGSGSRMRSTGRSRQVGRWLTTRRALTKMAMRMTRIRTETARSPTSNPGGTSTADRSGDDRAELVYASLSSLLHFFRLGLLLLACQKIGIVFSRILLFGLERKKAPRGRENPNAM